MNDSLVSGCATALDHLRAAETAAGRIDEYTITKSDLARDLNCTERTIDNYVKCGLLPPPLKFGVARCARVRWRPADKTTFMRNLAALVAAQRKAA